MADTKNLKEKLSGETSEEVMANETVEETAEAVREEVPSEKAQEEPVKSKDELQRELAASKEGFEHTHCYGVDTGAGESACAPAPRGKEGEKESRPDDGRSGEA